LDQIDIGSLLSILNQPKVREHLVEHASFDRRSIQRWIQTKTEMDSLKGCHVRGWFWMGNWWVGVAFNWRMAITRWPWFSAPRPGESGNRSSDICIAPPGAWDTGNW